MSNRPDPQIVQNMTRQLRIVRLLDDALSSVSCDCHGNQPRYGAAKVEIERTIAGSQIPPAAARQATSQGGRPLDYIADIIVELKATGRPVRLPHAGATCWTLAHRARPAAAGRATPAQAQPGRTCPRSQRHQLVAVALDAAGQRQLDQGDLHGADAGRPVARASSSMSTGAGPSAASSRGRARSADIGSWRRSASGAAGPARRPSRSRCRLGRARVSIGASASSTSSGSVTSVAPDLQQLVGALGARIERMARHGEHLAALLGGHARRDQRARAARRLDDQHAQREARDDAVAAREILGRAARSPAASR